MTRDAPAVTRAAGEDYFIGESRIARYTRMRRAGQWIGTGPDERSDVWVWVGWMYYRVAGREPRALCGAGCDFCALERADGHARRAWRLACGANEPTAHNRCYRSRFVRGRRRAHRARVRRTNPDRERRGCVSSGVCAPACGPCALSCQHGVWRASAAIYIYVGCCAELGELLLGPLLKLDTCGEMSYVAKIFASKVFAIACVPAYGYCCSSTSLSLVISTVRRRTYVSV